METVSLDSLQAISTCAPCDIYRDLLSSPSSSITKGFRMDKDFEYALQGMEREVKNSSPAGMSSKILVSSTPPLENPPEEIVDPIPVWGQRYDSQPSHSSFSFAKRNHLKQDRGNGKTKLSKFGQYSAVVVKNKNEKKKNIMPLSEMKIKESQLISTLGKLKGGNADKGVSFVFGDINPTVEKHCRKNISVHHINPANSNNENISDNSSVGTSSTVETTSEYEEELATILSRIQLVTSQPSSLKFQFGEELADCDLMDGAETKTPEPEPIKVFVQQPQADRLLALQDESLRLAMQRRRKKEALFW